MKKKCKHCGEKFTPKYSSLEQFCSKEDCRIQFAILTVKKKKESEEKARQRKNIIEKRNLRSATTNWKNALQDEINKIVRLIDKDLPCLARKKIGKMNAGHVFSRGSSPTIRFNLHNIHRQNAQSNHFQNDDGLLREGLSIEYGEEYFTFISELRRTPKLKYKDFEYEVFTKEAKKIVLSLAKLDLTYSLKNRIDMRNKINEQLGIYENEYCFFDNTSNTSNISNI
jgi:hypothetical protein